MKKCGELQEKLEVLLKLCNSSTLKLMYTSDTGHAFIEPYEVLHNYQGEYRLVDYRDKRTVGELYEGFWHKIPGEIAIFFRHFDVLYSMDTCTVYAYNQTDYWRDHEPEEIILRTKEDFFNLSLVRELPISYNDFELLQLYSPEFNKYVRVNMRELND